MLSTGCPAWRLMSFAKVLRVSSQQEVNTPEPHWGHPEKSQVRTDTSRGERIAGITWLTVGSLFCLFICVLYVGARVEVSGRSIPTPWPVLFAPWFNLKITRTALLWTKNIAVAGIPIVVWFLGFLLLIMWPELSGGAGPTFLPATIWTMLMLIAGMAFGAWPLRPKFDLSGPGATA